MSTAADDVVADLQERLSRALAHRDELEAASARARERSEGATPGGLTGYDSAVLSGIRRKPNAKADARRHASYSHESRLALQLVDAERDLDRLEARLARAITERDRVRLTRTDLLAATHVRTRGGWHEVVRVNPKTVSVGTGYSWADRIPFEKILEARPRAS